MGVLDVIRKGKTVPKELSLILDAAGEGAMWRLWATGGFKLSSSMLYPAFLNKLEAAAVISMMGCEGLAYINMPAIPRIFNAARNQRIKELCGVEGWTPLNAAYLVGVSESEAFYVISEE